MRRIGSFATRLAGSSDLYESSGRHPYHSINFVTSHDGFPLSDLVSYRDKHNEANGEGNRDGENNNFSDNYGVKGKTRRKDVARTRLRQIKNMMATLLLSQGVPMILYGDECRRTQRGNNNAYCQDNEISWFNWDLVEENKQLVRFVRELIAFRRRQPTVRRTDFLSGVPANGKRFPDVRWYSELGSAVDWSRPELSLMCLLTAPGADEDPEGAGRDILLMINAMRETNWRFVCRPVARRTGLAAGGRYGGGLPGRHTPRMRPGRSPRRRGSSTCPAVLSAVISPNSRSSLRQSGILATSEIPTRSDASPPFRNNARNAFFLDNRELRHTGQPAACR